MTDEHSTSRRSFLRTGTIASTALVTGASGAIAQQIAASDASNLPATGRRYRYPEIFGRR